MKDDKSELFLGLLIASFCFSLSIFMISTALTFHYEDYKEHFEVMKDLYWEQKYWNWEKDDKKTRRLNEFTPMLPELPKTGVVTLPEAKNYSLLRVLSKVTEKKNFCLPGFKKGQYDDYDDDLNLAKRYNKASFALSLVDVALRVCEMFVFCALFYKKKDPEKEVKKRRGIPLGVFLILSFLVCFIFLFMHILAFNVFRNFYECLDEIKELAIKKLTKEKDKKIKEWENEIEDMKEDLENMKNRKEDTEDQELYIQIEQNQLEDYKNDNVHYVYETYFDDFGFTYRLLIACIALDACGAFMIGFTAIYFLAIYFKTNDDDDDDEKNNKGKVTITYPYND